MKELVFSIKDIFESKEQTGCLSQYNSEMYHIPAYQRGYKWGTGNNEAVTVLLNDLWGQYLKVNNPSKEYYLQYITVKPIEVNHKKCLEVIDGQQRLTTLSILLSNFSIILDSDNLAHNKLDYAIRGNFFKGYIYNKGVHNEIVSKKWEEFYKEDEEKLNKQDVYYLFNAAKKCNSFLNANKNEITLFYNYILNNVKLIVNSVEKHIESEQVFKNLNSNKVPLTETDLIKGLFITKVGRNISNGNYSFKELNEIRNNVGRQWDEISRWSSDKQISNLYFDNDNSLGVYKLLELVANQSAATPIKITNKKGEFSLFNYFLNQDNLLEHFECLLTVKNKLDAWFCNTETYNLIGFLKFSRSNVLNLNALLKCETRPDLIDMLITLKNSVLVNINIEDLNYDEPEDKNKLHSVLLAVNVFPEGQDKIRFNFYSFNEESWTLEHIFPQTPEGKKKILEQKHKEAIRQILADRLTPQVEGVLCKDERSQVEKEVYIKALKENKGLNSIGNMCLLSGKDNASIGCGFFNDKREKILERIQKGSFVPKHTFDVFSKMFSGADTDNMKAWSGIDIESHELHILRTLEA